MVKTSYLENLRVWQTLPQEVKRSGPKHGHGQAVEVNFGQSKFLTAIDEWNCVVNCNNLTLDP